MALILLVGEKGRGSLAGMAKEIWNRWTFRVNTRPVLGPIRKLRVLANHREQGHHIRLHLSLPRVSTSTYLSCQQDQHYIIYHTCLPQSRSNNNDCPQLRCLKWTCLRPQCRSNGARLKSCKLCHTVSSNMTSRKHPA